MKFPDSHALPGTVAKRVAVAAEQIVREELQQFEEQQLLREVRSSALSEIEKICEYLGRTPLVIATEGSSTVAVTNEYLHRNLSIPAGRMKGLRETLAEEPHIQVHFTGGGQITIYYKRPARTADTGPNEPTAAT